MSNWSVKPNKFPASGFWLILAGVLLVWEVREGSSAQAADASIQTPTWGVIGESRTTAATMAATIAQQIGSWFNHKYGIENVINDQLVKNSPDIAKLLTETGLPGVLYSVEIETWPTDLAHTYAVVGNSVQLIGAGTSPSAVYLAVRGTDQLQRGVVENGATVDLEKSFFLWFAKEAGTISCTSYPAVEIRRETDRIVADVRLANALKSAATGEAVQLALTYIDSQQRSDAFLKKMAEFKERSIELDREIKITDEKLNSELIRAQKASQVANSLAMVADILSLSAQIAMVTDGLGADTPSGASSVKSSSDLKALAEGVANQANASASGLKLKYDSSINQRTGIRNELLLILKDSKYPINAVPQLQ